jgi:NADPH:quinone reductase-like Zn-dependent oxidoreductase
MKAMLCKAFGPPESLVLEELPSPALSAGQVRIAVHAAGVNFPDVLMIQGKYQFKPPFPFAPGAEVAGEILEVAPDVTSPNVGDRVMALVGAGGFADEAVAAAGACIPLPKSMDYVTGAGFQMTYGTSYYALVQRAQLHAGETLLIHGAAGGVGTAAIDIGRNLGAKIIATGGSDEKLARVAKHYGVEHVINYRTTPNWRDTLKAMTGSERRVRRRRRRVARALHPQRRVEWPDPGDWLCGWRHPEDPSEPAAPEERGAHRRILGRVARSRAARQPRQFRDDVRVARGGQARAHRLAHVPA